MNALLVLALLVGQHVDGHAVSPPAIGGDVVRDIDMSGFKIDNLLVDTFTLDQYVSSGSAPLGPTAPTNAENASCGGKMFDADNESVHFRYHVPGCWTAASDITFKVEWCNESGDAVADTETVKFDFEFRSIVWSTEGADNGSAVVVTATHTQSGAGGAADTFETTLTIDYDGATQPVSAGDVIVGHFDRDVTGDTYSGGAIVAGWEFSIQCNTIPDHGN